MLKSWLTTVWFSLTIPFASADEFQPLRWGYVEFPPYHYSENGKVVGAIAEKVDYIFKQTKIEYSAFVFPNKTRQVIYRKREKLTLPW